jgi:ADP-dependent NAD(P)H-hydrate dehydratase
VSRCETIMVTTQLLHDWRLPDVAGDKDARGTALIVGGSPQTPGAVLLAGVSALRAGAGVLQLAAAPSTAAALSVQVPEALVLGVPEDERPPDRLAELALGASAIAIGPGLDHIGHAAALIRFIDTAAPADTPIVLEAYALDALSVMPDLIAAKAGRYVLTPNREEARRLLDAEIGDLMEAAIAIAVRYQAVVSLVGRIAEPGGQTWWEQSGVIGLGTPGGGDMRAGIVAGLLARGADLAQAATWAAYAYAAAAQRLAPRFGHLGFLARELVDEVPAALAAV